MNDLVAGHVPVAFSALSSVQAQVAAGRLRLLGVATRAPSPRARHHLGGLCRVDAQPVPGLS